MVEAVDRDLVELDVAMPINEQSEFEELTRELSEALPERHVTAEILVRCRISPAMHGPFSMLFWRALYACASPNLPLPTG